MQTAAQDNDERKPAYLVKKMKVRQKASAEV